jgi:hypothetical protein
MTPETIPDNSRLVAALLELLAVGKPLYGSFRGRPDNQTNQPEK